MEWPEATIERLRRMWESGMLTEDIGRALGCSKSAAIGKARRVGCEPRPSPIRARDPSVHRPPTRLRRSVTRPVGSTLPPLATQLPPAPERTARAIYAAPRPAPEPVVVPIPTGRVVECSWPLGEPKTRAFRYCDVPSVPGKSFCAEHCARAYQKTHRQEHMEA